MNPSRRIIIAHNALQHSPKIYKELTSQGWDVKLIVPYIYKPNKLFKLINKISPNFLEKIKEKREVEGIKPEGIRNVVFFEILKITINSLPLDRYKIEFCQRKLDHLFDILISFYIFFQNSETILISYPNVCRRSFKVARRNGIKCILDLPTMHHLSIEKILKEERIRYPELTDQLINPINLFNKRLNIEMELANKIIIPSSTVERSFPICSSLREKLVIIPYGSNFKVRNNNLSNKSLKSINLIVIGQIQQRKGILYVLEALDKLLRDKHKLPIKVKFCGNNYLPNQTKFVNENICFKGFLSKDEIQNELKDSHILLSGSLIEGFSLAIAEAISQGVVPVVTDHCGADFIRSGENGFIVPIRSSEAIYQKVKLLIENEEMFRKFQSALSPSLTELTWSRYGEIWNKTLNKVIC